MNLGKKTTRFVAWVGILLLQLIMTQVVTFLASLFLPDMENLQRTQPLLFVIVVGITFSVGIILAGWLAVKFGWLVIEPKYPARIVATLIGAYVPLILALAIYPRVEAGNPFFSISILAGILGFHIPSWMKKK